MQIFGKMAKKVGERYRNSVFSVFRHRRPL